MNKSIRTRTIFILCAAIVCSTLTSTLATILLFASKTTSEQLFIATLVISMTLLILILVSGFMLTKRSFKPLDQLVQSSQEIAHGRHPEEAFQDIELYGEIKTISESLSTLALRLREIDASDRRFLMSISHELRTPLTAITGHAQAIEDFADDENMRETSLEVIRKEAARLERLIEDIVDLARIRSNRFTTVTESLWLDELGDHLLAIFRDEVALVETAATVSGEFEHVLLHSDGQRILQILRNLVGNGLRYAKTYVTIQAKRSGGHIRITVENDGEPITAVERDRIFNPFVGTKREGGLGLGLTIGRELAWALGGNLDCIPNDNGATFELMLPLEPPGYGR